MNLNVPRILQNQRHFSTAPYREHVTPLHDALRLSGFPEWTTRINLEGCWCGVLLYLCASRYNVVVSVSLLPAFVYGLLCRIFTKPRALHVCKEFYLEAGPQEKSFVKKLRLALLRFALKKVDAIVLNATGESEYYSTILDLPQDRFHFIAWPSNISEPELISESSGYFLAVGRSLRDWDTFFEAVAKTPCRYIVIASSGDAATFPSLKNVIVKTEVERQEYLNILRGAKGVILPLKPTIRSTGQASFLEAMAYGKPVIASDVVGVNDYLCHEKNALLCQPQDEGALRDAIMRIEDDPFLRDRIAEAGYHSINDKFNKAKYGENMMRIITDLLLEKTASRQPNCY